MEITIANGNVLSLVEIAPDKRWEARLTVAADGDGFILTDNDGERTTIQGSLIRDNGLVIHDGAVTVSLDLYQTWFARVWAERVAALAREDLAWWERYAALVYARRREVYADGRMFFCAASLFQFGTSFAGALSVPLGMLLELWDAGKLTVPCPNCGQTAYTYQGGGGLSSAHWWRAFCPACNEHGYGPKGGQPYSNFIHYFMDTVHGVLGKYSLRRGAVRAGTIRQVVEKLSGGTSFNQGGETTGPG
jgi:hypothetical protein